MSTCLPRQRFRSCPSSSRKLKSRGLGSRHPNKSVLLLKSTICVSVHMDVNKNDKIYTNTFWLWSLKHTFLAASMVWMVVTPVHIHFADLSSGWQICTQISKNSPEQKEPSTQGVVLCHCRLDCLWHQCKEGNYLNVYSSYTVNHKIAPRLQLMRDELRFREAVVRMRTRRILFS